MISKEEMRRARLIAMGASGSVSETAPRPITTETNVQHSNEQVEKRRHISTEDSSPLSVQVMGGIKKLMYENGGATDEDISRWYNQGFVFCESPSFGLRQENGGPCGILAVVQAEILKFAIFSNSVESVGVSKLPTPQIIEVQRMFANACSSILARAAEGKGTSDGVICILDCPNLKLFPSSPSSDLVVHRIHSESEASRFILERLKLFSSSVGCIVFLFSLMLSRGLERLAQDMDIDSNTLIGPYGHCAQELLNLLLTGAASSNILDGNISMNGMIVKGISQRSSVGYLTQLESLRYCQAGNFYKVPIFPVWVIGSLSHFTVLFALDRRVNDETDSERLLNLAQRAFRAADPEENGFIPSAKLKEVLEVLKYDDIITNEVELARLRGHLQIDGGIILWSGFWENVSRLITKETTLDALINVSASGNHSASVTGNIDMIEDRKRSDSVLAREMQAEIDGSLLVGLNTDNYQFEPIPVSNRIRSDSDLARELQDQWNNEEFMGSTGPNIPPPPYSAESLDSFPSVSSPLRSPVRAPTAGSSNPLTGSSIRSEMHRHDSFADERAVQHLLYHFNGLEGTGRPARLTPFKLIPRSSQNAIGMSMAMGGASDNTSSGLSSSIEEVLRTRWPGSRMDWMGQSPPSID